MRDDGEVSAGLPGKPLTSLGFARCGPGLSTGQPRLQHRSRRRVEEAEADRALLRLDRMVQPVSLGDSKVFLRRRTQKRRGLLLITR